MNLKQLTKLLEVELKAVSKRNTKLFTERAIEIVCELRQRYPIKGIRMGMGDWWIDGGKVEFYTGLLDGENPQKRVLTMSELKDWVDPHYGNEDIEPVGCTKRHHKLFRELGELLNFVEENRILDCIWITEKDLIAYEKANEI